MKTNFEIFLARLDELNLSHENKMKISAAGADLAISTLNERK
tara:strand:+ start:3794 stop:3919 length:126 start_codon:yes stop_codon:yes gene_type:complete